jgi:uncharacterized DUF497 family protein
MDLGMFNRVCPSLKTRALIDERRFDMSRSDKNSDRYVIPMHSVNVYAIIIVLCISIDKSNIRTRSLRNTHSQETQHLSWETL